MKINLYDFDKTIYYGDSSTQFFFYSLKKYPRILKKIPLIAKAYVKYVFKKYTKTQMKQDFFSFLTMIPDINLHVESFWKTHERKLKPFYMKRNHNKDIIISASPEFLLKPIIDKLGVLDFFGSDVDKLTGKFNRDNCHGEEKVRRLNEKYSDYDVIESYSDSLSDTPILKLAKKAYLVKKDKLNLTKF